jgi:hypothetical protein
MRHLITLFSLVLTLAAGASPADRASVQTVLFVGNSHTYFNDLPGLFTDLAGAANHDVYVDESTMGGASLEDHSKHPTTLAKIAERRWDHVVLQEHSLYPVIEHYRETSFYPAARTLDSLIAVQDSGTSLFMTWGWDLGGELCVGEYCSPDFPDYSAMQAAVSVAYGRINDELGSFLVPVGNLWATALLADPKSPLWSGDHYHPSPEGSYLAACVFFARFFDESPEGLEFHGGIDPERALFYQRIAGRMVTAAPASSPGPRLLANHPNPFNPRTTLSFELPVPAEVTLEFFDARGRRIDVLSLGDRPAGSQLAIWDAGGAPSGTYLCRLRAGDTSHSRKLTLVR